jgi:cytochrome b561
MANKIEETERNIFAIPRSVAGDDRTRYDALSIGLHWITALLVLLLFSLAEIWGYFPKSERYLLIVGHISFGLVLIFVLGLRIAWRLTLGHKVRDAGAGTIHYAAKAVHYVLYVLLSAQVLLGILTRWTDNKALTFFGLQISSPLGTFSKATGDFVDQIHNVTGWMIMGLVGAHVVAALFHHFIVRDDTLARMLPRRERL